MKGIRCSPQHVLALSTTYRLGKQRSDLPLPGCHQRASVMSRQSVWGRAAMSLTWSWKAIVSEKSL